MKLIILKSFYIYLGLLSLLLLVGCGYKNSDGSIHAPKLDTELDCYTIVIDSCEYIISSSRMAHKGNCNYCAKRREKDINTIIKGLKSDDSLW